MKTIEKIRQEIEKRINILTNVYAEQVERKDEEMMNYYHGKLIALEELRPFLDTLSEEPDKSLEEEMEEFFETMPVLEHENIFEDTFKNIARHFAEWGAEHLRDTTKMIDKSLEEAAEGEVYKFGHYSYVKERNNEDLTKYLSKFNNGDKVRIVVLKAEEE